MLVIVSLRCPTSGTESVPTARVSSGSYNYVLIRCIAGWRRVALLHQTAVCHGGRATATWRAELQLAAAACDGLHALRVLPALWLSAEDKVSHPLLEKGGSRPAPQHPVVELLVQVEQVDCTRGRHEHATHLAPLHLARSVVPWANHEKVLGCGCRCGEAGMAAV